MILDGHVLLDTLIRPSNLIPPVATAIHQIADTMVAPTFPQVYDELMSSIQDRIGSYLTSVRDIGLNTREAIKP